MKQMLDSNRQNQRSWMIYDCYVEYFSSSFFCQTYFFGIFCMFRSVPHNETQFFHFRQCDGSTPKSGSGCRHLSIRTSQSHLPPPRGHGDRCRIFTNISHRSREVRKIIDSKVSDFSGAICSFQGGYTIFSPSETCPKSWRGVTSLALVNDILLVCKNT